MHTSMYPLLARKLAREHRERSVISISCSATYYLIATAIDGLSFAV